MKLITKWKFFILPTIFAAIAAGGFWVNGFDFNQRGPDALNCYTLSIALAAFGGVCAWALESLNQ